MLRLVAAALGCAALTAAPAAAHLGGGEGVAPFVDGDAVVGAGTTWGLVLADDDGYRQTCEEAIGDVPRAFVRRGARVFAATGRGVVVTVDGGCDWSVVEGTADRAVLGLEAAGALLLAITGDVGVPNQLLVSDDGGPFAARHTTPSGVLLTSLAVGNDGLILLAGADTTAAAPVLLMGDIDELRPLQVPALEGARLARALAVDDDAVWVSFLDEIGRGHLIRLPRVDGLVDVDNAVDVGAFDGLVRATGVAGGFRFVIAAAGVVSRVVDDGAATAPAAWSRTSEGPLTCLRRVDGDDRLWGCATQLDGVWFKATRDGETWEPVLPFADVTVRECPLGSAGAACPDPTAPPVADPPDGDTPGPSTVAPSCGAGVGATWPALPLLMRRRRRR